MKIKLWKDFSKRKNSTKQPADSDAVTLEMTLKEGTSIEAPVFTLKSNEFTYNYCQALGHYYFIRDIVSEANGYIRISCEQDLLATYKANITALTANVQYSASSYNLDITDPRMMPSNDFTARNSEYSSVGFTFSEGGTYILGAMNGDTTGYGGLATYYALTLIQLQNVAATLNTDDFLTQLAYQWTNPKEAIVSCIWVPIDIGDITGVSSTVKFGSLDTTVAGKKITERVYGYLDKALTIPWNYTARSYLDKAPFTTGELFLPFVGVVPFDVDVYYNLDSFKLSMFVDILTGDIVYRITSGDVGANVSTYSGNCATSLPLSASSYNAAGIVSGAISTIGGIATSVIGALTAETGAGVALAVAGGTTAAAGGTYATAQSLQTHTQTNGSNSSCLGVRQGKLPKLAIYTRKPSEDIEAMKAVKGLPLFKTVTLSTLSGYTQCSQASINMPGLGSDKDTVSQYLNTGFFIE